MPHYLSITSESLKKKSFFEWFFLWTFIVLKRTYCLKYLSLLQIFNIIFSLMLNFSCFGNRTIIYIFSNVLRNSPYELFIVFMFFTPRDYCCGQMFLLKCDHRHYTHTDAQTHAHHGQTDGQTHVGSLDCLSPTRGDCLPALAGETLTSPSLTSRAKDLVPPAPGGVWASLGSPSQTTPQRHWPPGRCDVWSLPLDCPDFTRTVGEFRFLLLSSSR